MIWTLGGRHERQGLAKRRSTNSYEDKKGHDCFCRWIKYREVNIVNSELKEPDRLSDDSWWLLLTVVEHTCLSGRTLSGTIYPQAAYLPCHTFMQLILSTLKVYLTGYMLLHFFLSQKFEVITSVSAYNPAFFWCLKTVNDAFRSDFNKGCCFLVVCRLLSLKNLVEGNSQLIKAAFQLGFLKS